MRKPSSFFCAIPGCELEDIPEIHEPEPSRDALQEGVVELVGSCQFADGPPPDPHLKSLQRLCSRVLETPYIQTPQIPARALQRARHHAGGKNARSPPCVFLLLLSGAPRTLR